MKAILDYIKTELIDFKNIKCAGEMLSKLFPNKKFFLDIKYLKRLVHYHKKVLNI